MSEECCGAKAEEVKNVEEKKVEEKTTEIKTDELKRLVIAFRGGQFINAYVPMEIVQFCIAKWLEVKEYMALSEEQKSKKEKPKLNCYCRNEKGEIFWAVDLSEVCGMYLANSEFKQDSNKAYEEALAEDMKIRREVSSTTKEMVKLMKKQVKDETHGEGWRDGGEKPE